MTKIGIDQVTPGEGRRHVFPGTTVVVEDLPKISLHDHLDGGVRPATIIELAAEFGIVVPAGSASELNAWIRSNADSGKPRRLSVDVFRHPVGDANRSRD